MGDTQKARLMDQDGNYVKVDGRGKTPLNCQETFYAEAIEAAKQYDTAVTHKIFQPMEAPEEDEEYKDQEE